MSSVSTPLGDEEEAAIEDWPNAATPPDRGMALKRSGRASTIREQIVENAVSSLTLRFEVVPNSAARYRLMIVGALPFRNREILFNVSGEEAGAGTMVGGKCRAAGAG